MKRCWLSSLLWASSILASPVAAQDAELPGLHLEEPCAPEVTENRSGAAEVDGAPTLWFHREVARCLLGRQQVLPLYVERVGLLEQRLVISDERDALRSREVALAVAEAEAATGALEAAMRLAREATEAAQFERDLRWLWFGVGVAVVVLLEALAVWILSEVRIVI